MPVILTFTSELVFKMPLICPAGLHCHKGVKIEYNDG